MTRRILIEWPCPLCGGTDMTSLVSTSDYNHKLPGKFVFGRCLHCGLTRQNPRPHPRNLGDFYPKNYGTSVAYNQDIEARIDSIANRRRFKELSGFHPEAGDLLDIGCGRGFFLAFMERKGWQVAGCDSGPEHIDFARGLLRSRNLAVRFWPDESLPFDKPRVLTLFHLLEHLNAPLEAMSEARNLLKTGGILVIETPNIDSIVAVLYGSRANLYDAPRHLCLFNAATLTMLLNKAGFQIIKMIAYTPTLLGYRESLRYVIKDMGLRNYDVPHHEKSTFVTTPQQRQAGKPPPRIAIRNALHRCEDVFFSLVDKAASRSGKSTDLLCIARKR